MRTKAKLVGSYFGTIYLTVISLLQGIVLSQLVPEFIKYHKLSKLTEDTWSNDLLLPFLLMLLIIFVVWHHYASGIFFLRWFPNIIDTIIPFIIGVFQFFLLSYLVIDTSLSDIDLKSWTQGFALILLSGSFGYFGACWRLNPKFFIDIMRPEDAEKHVTISKKYYARGGWSVLIQGIVASFVFLLGREDLLWISLILIIAHIILFEYYLLRTIQPHFEKAMDAYDALRGEG